MQFDYHITDIGWRRTGESYESFIEWYNNSTDELQQVPLKDFAFDFKLSEHRYCIGHIDDDDKWQACPNQTLLTKKTYERCYICEQKHGFRAAFFFDVEPTSERMKKYLEQEHLVYLAYFEPDYLKVGTAHITRKEIRLLEQDALIFAFIARVPNATEVKSIERTISKQYNITEFAKSGRKFNNIMNQPDFAQASQLITSAFDRISDTISPEYKSMVIKKREIQRFDNQEYVTFPDIQPDLLREPEFILGNFKGLRGRFLLLENPHKIVGWEAYDVKELVGRRLINIM